MLSLCGHTIFFLRSGLHWWGRGEVLSLVWQSDTELSAELSLLCTWWARMKVVWSIAMTSGDDTLCLQQWRQACSLNVLYKSSQKNEVFLMGEAEWDWTLHPLFLLLHNEYAYGWVCVSLCALMCVVVCELSQTPPDLCPRKLISAVHKGALCPLQDRLSGQWIHCLTTPSPTQANWYEPLSPEIIGSSVFLY